MIKLVLLTLLTILPAFGTVKLPFLYNCWQFEDTSVGVNAQPFEIATPAYEAGVFGNALRCNGTNSSGGVAIGTGTFVYHESFTGLVWLKPYSLAINQLIVDSRVSSGSGMVLQLGNSGVPGILIFGLKEGAVQRNVYATNSLSTNTWYCVFFGFNSVTGKTFLRVNGAQEDALVFPIVPSTAPAGNIAIGTSPTLGGVALDGAVDMFTLWKGRVLSNTEMTEIENGDSYPYR